MDKITFADKTKTPTQKDLINALGNSYSLWQEVINIVHLKLPAAISEWNFPGEKYGWSFRMKDKKRTILYFLPGDRSFRVAFVFGPKAYEAIMTSNMPGEIKSELKSAKVYVEGRGIRLDVKNKKTLKDITRLIEFKLAI